MAETTTPSEPAYLDPEELLTLAEAAAELKLSYSTVSKLSSRGEFAPGKAFKLPGSSLVRISRADLLAWLASTKRFPRRRTDVMTVRHAPRRRGDELLTLRESAAELKLSYSAISKMNARGEFAPGRTLKLPGGHIRISRADLHAWARGKAV